MTPPRSLATPTHPLDTAGIRLGPRRRVGTQQAVLFMGSSLTAIFAAGMIALTIAIVISVQPTADQGSGEMTVHPDAVAPPIAVSLRRRCAAAGAKTVPAPAPAAPPPEAIPTAQLMVPPAPPPPRVVVRNAAPAPAAPRPTPPPPVVHRQACRRRSSVAAADSAATPFISPGPRGRGLATATRGPRRPRRPRRRGVGTAAVTSAANR